jgi:hypothetical protein
VPLRRLLPLLGHGLADVQVQHVVLGVVVGRMEDERSDADVHALHEGGSFRCGYDEMIRARACS